MNYSLKIPALKKQLDRYTHYIINIPTDFQSTSRKIRVLEHIYRYSSELDTHLFIIGLLYLEGFESPDILRSENYITITL